MRSGASVSQLFALIVLPRGARMTRVLSSRLGIVSPLRESEARFQHAPQRLLNRLGELCVPAWIVVLVRQVAADRELHLHGMDAVSGPAVVARDVAALEAAIHHGGPLARGTDRNDSGRERGIAGRA